MTNIGGVKHEEVLGQKLSELTKQGWRIIRFNSKLPDAIGIKNGKIIAIDAMLSYVLSNGIIHSKAYALRRKAEQYKNLGFDEVVTIAYANDKRIDKLDINIV